MKKNNLYLTDEEIDLGDIIKSLWKEKILVLSISIICGLAGYLYASFQPQKLKIDIKLKNPPSQLFEPYYQIFNNKGNVIEVFVSDFKINLLSLNNVQSFIEENIEFDNFKKYLQSRNISIKEYFANRIHEAKDKNLIIPNKYFLVFTKELDGDFFLSNYVEFTKKKLYLI